MFKNMKQIESFFKERQILGIKPGLNRIEQLLNRLDNPQEKLKAIHIAGTNGKGSTINFLKNALIANGYQVGVFTSPSMSGVIGHLFINDQPIDKDLFISIFNDIFPDIQKLDKNGHYTTEFEIMTAIAFVYFSTYVDIALIETGMGGREDATNCVHPLISIITNVSWDHTAFLGNTIEKITYHKAGIIKANIPVIIGKMQSSVLHIISQEAQLKKAPIYKLEYGFTYSEIEATQKGQRFIWHNKETSYPVTLLMNGRHQVENSSLAIKALAILKDKGFLIEWNKTLKALGRTQIPGRFETVHRKPTIILDGAHNPAGIESFLQTLLLHYNQVEKHLIFGVFKDKELDHMIQQCIPHFQSVTLTSFNHQRAAGIDELSKYNTLPNVNITVDWEEHLLNVFHNTDHKDISYFITGSLNFISQVREVMNRRGLL